MALPKSIKAVLLAGLLLPVATGSQQSLTNGTSSHSPFNDSLAKFVGDVMDRWKVAGMSVAVVDGDSVYSQGYGYATLPDTKATPDTLYFAGSTSKAFTAAAVALMIDSQNHSALADGWSTTISSIIRNDFVMYEDWSTEHLTLEDAASHRTGMPRHDAAMFARHEDGSPVTTAQQVQNLRHLKPSATPRTTWQYCNYMYTVLGHVVEVVAGKWLGDVLHESIWAPLGMTATFGDTKDAVAAPEHLAAGYYWDSNAERFVEMHLDSTREDGGAGLVISTVADYTKWARCLLDQTAPFSKAAHAEIRKSRMLMGNLEDGVMGDGDMTYGLGWIKKTYHGEVVWKHGGTMNAYSTQLYLIPRLRYAVAAMANSGLANSAEDEVVWRLVEDKLGVPQELRYNLTSSYKEFTDEQKTYLEKVDSIFYPNRPEKAIPSSLTNEQIVGHYYDPGYGTLRIVQGDVGGKTLVANRTEPIFLYYLRFRHVSGNYWLVDAWDQGTKSIASTLAGEFKVGVDGKATGLELQLTPKGELGEPNVLFERV
ncbi:penicillin-binding protein, putative [Cordyceps militaris CM01]|uniref:Penicillin-binding protein, putative n=1 Tax=Cordyceps militaris (strain CM01) TaxID=983644 RepID=G3J5J0_CORMM|nr:penicillin-binding protein, putative [Cordyceps militaris CM01]EGX96051.1 penicillin-binding protein, putative [Cordyceps militaris CM01]